MELIICYDELINNNIQAIGETLYTEHFFFCNTYELLDSKYQVPWEDFKNMLLVTNANGLNKINTRIYKIVQIQK